MMCRRYLERPYLFSTLTVSSGAIGTLICMSAMYLGASGALGSVFYHSGMYCYGVMLAQTLARNPASVAMMRRILDSVKGNVVTITAQPGKGLVATTDDGEKEMDCTAQGACKLHGKTEKQD